MLTSLFQTFMNWRVPVSRSTTSMSTRPGTSLQRLDEAKEARKKSPYTKEDVPAVEPEKLLATKEQTTPRSVKKQIELPEKEKAILKDWLQKASVTDKVVISDLIECADRLTLTTVTGRKFRPGPSAAIKLWLKNANDAEKQIAEKFLDNLEVLDLISGSKQQDNGRGTGFGPLMDRSKDLGYRDGKGDKDIDVLFDCVSRELLVPVSKPFSTSPRYAPHFGADKTPAALWHLDQKRDVRYSVLNNTANFINPNKDRGSHFDIHPDWPSYYN
ncbi:hypothetical protein ACHWQZ_G016903 [Mnemiopsis leidyi]